MGWWIQARVSVGHAGWALLACAGCSGGAAETSDACAPEGATQVCDSPCGSGLQTCTNLVWSSCSTAPKHPIWRGTVRDFTYENADFNGGQYGLRVPDIGSVQPTLNAVDKPELRPEAKPHTIESAETFNAWWSDVNPALGLDVELLPVPKHPNAFEFSDQEFFPINGQLLASLDDPRLNNGRFTYEARFEFVYRGGEFFTLSSDDDSWLFLNRGLAIDLGGLHSVGGRALRVDAVAADLGIEIGKTYPAHLFFAERMPGGSELVMRSDLIAPDACE